MRLSTFAHHPMKSASVMLRRYTKFLGTHPRQDEPDGKRLERPIAALLGALFLPAIIFIFVVIPLKGTQALDPFSD